MVRKLLLASMLLLTGCDARESSSVMGDLVTADCKDNKCYAIVYSKGLLNSYAAITISTCNENYYDLIGKPVMVVRYPDKVPVLQKTETAIVQCNKVFPFKPNQ